MSYNLDFSLKYPTIVDIVAVVIWTVLAVSGTGLFAATRAPLMASFAALGFLGVIWSCAITICKAIQTKKEN